MLLHWSHATNSLESMTKALNDPKITAIECDVMMGTTEDGGTNICRKPILSHPPNRKSDICIAALMRLAVDRDDNGTKSLLKHLKLDFKEIEAVKPSLDLLRMSELSNAFGKTLVLNADILPGPGSRKCHSVPPDIFLETCFAFIHSYKKDSNLIFSLSLGYKCDWSSREPYRDDDVAAMAEILRSRNFTELNVGVVLALNARLLAVRPEAFDNFLREFPSSSILAWTGSGEPAIPRKVVEMLSAQFRSKGMEDRINFDCQMEEEDI